MPRGRQTRAKRTATKRKTDGKDEDPPPKLQREDSGNARLRLAIDEAKASASTKKKKSHKPDYILPIHHPQATVYQDYTCMLNQTNIGNNNNKFYIIQLVQDKKGFICFTRWGRVGEDGTCNSAIVDDSKAAINLFKKKFKDKTKNDWEKRNNFTPHPGKYTMIEIDEDDDVELEVDTADGGQQMTRTLITFTGPCPLDARTMLMIEIIYSDYMFNDQMAAMQLDIRKMPLGKLSKAQIATALETLLDIEAAIKNKKSRQVLVDLSSKFYTHCPHDFGRNVPPVLDKESIVQQKKDVMLTLSDIELTQSLQKEMSDQIHPLLEKYQKLECEMDLLDKDSEEYKLLHEYATACPRSRKGTLLDIWRIDRKGEKERFQKHKTIRNRKLLWHGTNIAVVAAILKAGLRILPHSGGSVGKGIYFASAHALSCFFARGHYGEFHGEKNVGFMFLVEVALGKEKSITQCDPSLTQPPSGFNSVVARGLSEPDPKKNKKVVLDGKEVTVPVGEPVPQKEWSKSSFHLSEYLVYKESQAKLRYLLKFSFA